MRISFDFVISERWVDGLEGARGEVGLYGIVRRAEDIEKASEKAFNIQYTHITDIYAAR